MIKQLHFKKLEYIPLHLYNFQLQNYSNIHYMLQIN
jgi:hypothetical protein